MDFLEIGLIELIDIVLVAVLIYQLYKLVKGTVAINIFIGLAFIIIKGNGVGSRGGVGWASTACAGGLPAISSIVVAT